MALSGLKVIEFAGLAPGPFAGLVLADNGASVIRVDRPSTSSSDLLCRGKRSIVVNSKVTSGRELLKTLIASADVIIDPFRPGVMERLGLGPEVFLGDGTKAGLNERLIYARIVGPLQGHGRPRHQLCCPERRPGYFAGGGIMCALGILVALLERGKTGKGQVVNADMVTGTRYISSFPLIHALVPSSPLMGGPRGTNLLDGGAPFYNIYSCKDGGWMSVGCLEPEFFKVFLELFLGALPRDFTLAGWRPTLATQRERSEWDKFAKFLEKGFLTKPRDEWAKLFMNTEACTVPVLTPKEAGKLARAPVPEVHPKVKTWNSTALQQKVSPSIGLLQPGKDTEQILDELGISDSERRRLVQEGAVDGKFVSVRTPSKL
ncbi:alpha-methylacyl-CoA racemase [Coprinopsis cinerea okayama7|uniref:Alpha-methylacyl-CoA racemase n=1 Tax=Coprinopsis cinerea (strain Okayama-7 / 130 / ATCC MYA-4618 / FGSC 9003) TaxID=240176 RepID=A8NTX0_COPC7|nr:alpha-methylacyl-CoA racemase [Coprinopsis cinerea okayama7\|eukprot:XP_001836322.2 alpha-methylacyl-CoA racemase [Coprinopsis cinerea okayama7\